MHLKQPEFTYSACGPFTKNKQRIQRFMETGDTKYIYKNELDKTCFQHDMAYGDYKDLKRKTLSEKVLTRFWLWGVKITHPPPPKKKKNVKKVKNRQAPGLPGLFTQQNLVFEVS